MYPDAEPPTRAERKTGRVMMECPRTGKPEYTGFEMDPAMFDNTLFCAIIRKCRQCGQTHKWAKADAWLIEEVPFRPHDDTRRSSRPLI